MSLLADFLRMELGSGPKSSRGVGGGCISRTSVVDLQDGRRVFVKEHGPGSPGMFEAEAAGLAALRIPEGPRVPEVYGTFAGDETQYLVLEYLEAGPRIPNFWEDFGSALALMHRHGRSGRFGFPGDNFIGSTPQENGWMDDWVEFFAERRLGFQARLAARNGIVDSGFLRRIDTLRNRLPDLLVTEGEASILHGDLWSGNFVTGPDGTAAIIDPAVYFGHREADLAMTRLFGGYPEAFYAAYRETWPLEPGHEDRMDIYMLYHVLNHVNLFGGSYLGQANSILRRFV